MNRVTRAFSASTNVTTSGLGADRGCRQGRRVLRAAVDPEQVGVLAADPKHVRFGVHEHLEVVVRDPSLQRLEPGCSAGPEARRK